MRTGFLPLILVACVGALTAQSRPNDAGAALVAACGDERQLRRRHGCRRPGLFSARLRHSEKRYLIETTGSGVAMADFDDDGFVDIYLVNGSTLDRIASGSPAPKAAFFRNNGDRTFRDNTRRLGVANERWGQGVCAGDFDNDGDEDFYVTNFGPNRLYRNVGDGRFADVAAARGVAVDSWSTGCAFGDYDGDGWLDLYVAGYVAFDVKNPAAVTALRQAGEAKAPPPQVAQSPAGVAARHGRAHTRPARPSAPIAASR